MSSAVLSVENDSSGTPRVVIQPGVSWQALAERLAIPSPGNVGTVAALGPAGSGEVTIELLTYDTDETVATHVGPATYVCYIIRGRGSLTLSRGDPVVYQEDDCIILKPQVVHGWQGGDRPTTMLVVALG